MTVSRLSFSYPEGLKNQLVVLAKKDNRSLSSYVQNVLSDHIEKKTPKKRKRTKKA